MKLVINTFWLSNLCKMTLDDHTKLIKWTTINTVYSVTYYLEIRIAVSIYCVHHILSRLVTRISIHLYLYMNFGQFLPPT